MNCAAADEGHYRPMRRSYARDILPANPGSDPLGPRAPISIRTLPSAWLRRLIVTSWSFLTPRITPLPRSSEVIRTPSSCAADNAALQERSNVLGAGTGTGSDVVQPANAARMQITTTMVGLRLRALSMQTQSDFIGFTQSQVKALGDRRVVPLLLVQSRLRMRRRSFSERQYSAGKDGQHCAPTFRVLRVIHSLALRTWSGLIQPCWAKNSDK